MMVEAVSGQEVVEQRANLIRELTRLCKVVIRSGEDLVYTGNTEGFAARHPRRPRDLRRRVGLEGRRSSRSCTSPRPTAERKDKVPFGCLVAEQIGDELAPTDAHARTEVVVAARLDGALERPGARQDLPAARSSRRWAPPGGSSAAGPWPRSWPCSLAIVAVIADPGLRPLEADDRGARARSCPRSGRTPTPRSPAIVVEVPVEHGELVKKGDVLVKLESKELEKELQAAARRDARRPRRRSVYLDEPDRASATEPATTTVPAPGPARRGQDQGQERRGADRDHPGAARVDDVRSPQDGIITTWEVRRTCWAARSRSARS